MQTSIFCAESRIRCTKNRGYDTKALIKDQDVATALSMVGLPEDRSHFWLQLARRNQLKFMNKDGKKDQEDQSVLNYDEVERILGQTPVARRRRRSAWSTSESMSQTEDSDYLREYSIADVVDESETEESGTQQTMEQDNESRESSEHEEAEHSAEISEIRDHAQLDFMSQNEELTAMSEDDEDHHAEISDQVFSRRHEHHLYQDLGWTMSEDVESEQLQELVSEKELSWSGRRKFNLELLDWRDSISSYAESWEEQSGKSDEALFGDN